MEEKLCLRLTACAIPLIIVDVAAMTEAEDFAPIAADPLLRPRRKRGRDIKGNGAFDLIPGQENSPQEPCI